ncbi:MAG: DUF1801 domain-containing protein [Thermomicrobiales bacterium]
MANAPDTVDEYIAQFPAEVQAQLDQIRSLIHHLAPDSSETISYAIPAYKLHGKPLIYFAAYAKHIGLYPLPEHPSDDLTEAMAPFVAGKGTLRFPHTNPLPLDLIERVIISRMHQ